MMGNFFNNMYNGKSKSDFTKDQLPTNRISLFFEMLKIRFFKIIQLNFLFLVFALPFLFNTYIFANYIMLNDVDVFSMLWPYLVFNIPCLAIFGVGQVGVTYITRNWARDQHAWVWSDFLDALKANWKQGLLMGTLNGALIFLMILAFITYYIQNANLFFFVCSWVMILFMVILAMVNLYIWPMMITYKLKFRHLLRNSLILALGRLPWSLLMLVIVLIPIALIIFVHFAIALYYLVIGFAMTSFIVVSYTNMAFDRFINNKIEGAQINQGLHTPEDEDDDE